MIDLDTIRSLPPFPWAPGDACWHPDAGTFILSHGIESDYVRVANVPIQADFALPLTLPVGTVVRLNVGAQVARWVCPGPTCRSHWRPAAGDVSVLPEMYPSRCPTCGTWASSVGEEPGCGCGDALPGGFRVGDVVRRPNGPGSDPGDEVEVVGLGLRGGSITVRGPAGTQHSVRANMQTFVSRTDWRPGDRVVDVDVDGHGKHACGTVRHVSPDVVTITTDAGTMLGYSIPGETLSDLHPAPPCPACEAKGGHCGESHAEGEMTIGEAAAALRRHNVQRVREDPAAWLREMGLPSLWDAVWCDPVEDTEKSNRSILGAHEYMAAVHVLVDMVRSLFPEAFNAGPEPLPKWCGVCLHEAVWSALAGHFVCTVCGATSVPDGTGGTRWRSAPAPAVEWGGEAAMLDDLPDDERSLEERLARARRA